MSSEINDTPISKKSAKIQFHVLVELKKKKRFASLDPY